MTRSSGSVDKPFMSPYHDFGLPFEAEYTEKVQAEDVFWYIISMKAFHEDLTLFETFTKNEIGTLWHLIFNDYRSHSLSRNKKSKTSSHQAIIS